MAAEMLKQGLLSNGSLIITDHQYAGKGQRGNIWLSKAGENLTFSVVLKPSFLLPSNNFYLNIITSLSIIEGLNTIGLPDLKIKWPNDIMYKNRKLAGILIENSIQAGKINNSIIGIGLNTNQTDFEKSLLATSLKIILNKQLDLNDVLNEIIIQFEKSYFQLMNKNHHHLRDRYISKLFWINEIHTFKSSKTFHGIITGVDDTGRLEVKTDGSIQKFNFKEIKYIA